MVQRVKDLALSLKWFWSLLWCGFDPGLGTSVKKKKMVVILVFFLSYHHMSSNLRCHIPILEILKCQREKKNFLELKEYSTLPVFQIEALSLRAGI